MPMRAFLEEVIAIPGTADLDPNYRHMQDAGGTHPPNHANKEGI